MFRLLRCFDGLLRLTALTLLLSMLTAAMHDVSQAWDVWYYHMPFAARLWGIVKPSEFLFSADNAARFTGFPLLAEWLQGMLWRVTGLPTAANLVALAAVPAFAGLMRNRFSVPLHVTVLALLAIPLVHIHATSCYVDLPANCAASALVLITLDAYVKTTLLSWRSLLLAIASAAVAANMKSLLHPLVLVALLLVGWRQLVLTPSGRKGRLLLLMLAALPIVFASPLKNLFVHHNPCYPVRLTLLGHGFAGVELPYASSPVWLQSAPRPVRFAASVMELGVRPLTDRRRWTVDQWTPPDAPGYRMGGFFGGYVVAQLSWLLLTLACRRSRATCVTAVGFAALTALIAWMPQSHELRYYMTWAIVLVAINLWHAANGSANQQLALGSVALVALAVVLMVTRAGYAYPSGLSFSELLRNKTNARVLSKIPVHGNVCVVRAPFNLLWSAAFHRPLQYTVAEAEDPIDCKATLTIK